MNKKILSVHRFIELTNPKGKVKSFLKKQDSYRNIYEITRDEVMSTDGYSVKTFDDIDILRQQVRDEAYNVGEAYSLDFNQREVETIVNKYQTHQEKAKLTILKEMMTETNEVIEELDCELSLANFNEALSIIQKKAHYEFSYKILSEKYRKLRVKIYTFWKDLHDENRVEFILDSLTHSNHNDNIEI